MKNQTAGILATVITAAIMVAVVLLAHSLIAQETEPAPGPAAEESVCINCGEVHEEVAQEATEEVATEGSESVGRFYGGTRGPVRGMLKRTQGIIREGIDRRQSRITHRQSRRSHRQSSRRAFRAP